jgi:hypothetical protein
VGIHPYGHALLTSSLRNADLLNEIAQDEIWIEILILAGGILPRGFGNFNKGMTIPFWGIPIPWLEIEITANLSCNLPS